MWQKHSLVFWNMIMLIIFFIEVWNYELNQFVKQIRSILNLAGEVVFNQDLLNTKSKNINQNNARDTKYFTKFLQTANIVSDY